MGLPAPKLSFTVSFANRKEIRILFNNFTIAIRCMKERIQVTITIHKIELKTMSLKKELLKALLNAHSVKI